MKRRSIFVFLFVAVTLGACASGTVPSSAPVQRLSGVTVDGFCAGDYDGTLARLMQDRAPSAATRFFAALALEASGHPVPARQAFAALATGDGEETVSLTCPDKVWAHGLVTEEAGKRLALLARDLRAMGAVMGPPFALHKGLPRRRQPFEVVRMQTTPTARSRSYAAPQAPSSPVTVTKPASLSPVGMWFAHMASYKSAENARRYTGELEDRYPVLKGAFQEWITEGDAGTVWRIGIRTSEWKDADRFCIAVRSNGGYCRVIDTR